MALNFGLNARGLRLRTDWRACSGQGSGLGLGFSVRVWGLGFRVWGLGLEKG